MVATSGDWPDDSGREDPSEEGGNELFRESGETFLQLLDSLRDMSKAAEALSDRAITLDFSAPKWPQDFYELLCHFEQGVSQVRGGFVSYCEALGIELENPDLDD